MLQTFESNHDIDSIDHNDMIFSLDIGTRSVIGIVGYLKNHLFHILDMEQVFHRTRAMMDGQIEDIDAVGQCIIQIKETLEKRLSINLERVSIAAAGRALKTQSVTLEQVLDPNEVITAAKVHEMELKAIQVAHQKLVEINKDYAHFYCVGYNTNAFVLDDYKMTQIVGHKGMRCQLTLIVAFLPKSVVESLYAAMDQCGLTVASLTLEPIAAMNVLIPKELQLLNLALVDIGAGTSDIAISKDGTIIAYDMATIAGDEVSEAIMRSQLVDFETAEAIKMDLMTKDSLTFTNILGFEQTQSKHDLLHALSPTIDHLVGHICDKIIALNQDVPAAIFLVGGGSLYPLLRQSFAQYLAIDENRVAVGNQVHFKRVVDNYDMLNSPEFITPVGIALTSNTGQLFSFSKVYINGEPIRLFNFAAMTVSDILIMSGHYSYKQLMGYNGSQLRYTLNGQPKTVFGELGTPAQILVNGSPANLETVVEANDEIILHPAQNGRHASLSVEQLVSDWHSFSVTFDDISYTAGTIVTIDGQPADRETMIPDGSQVTLTSIITLQDLLQYLGEQSSINRLNYFCDNQVLDQDYVLQPNDDIQSMVPDQDSPLEREIPFQPSASPIEVLWPPSSVDISSSAIALSVQLNGKPLSLPPKEDQTPYMLYDLLNYVDPQLLEQNDRLLTFKVNDHEKPFTTQLVNNDMVTIG